MITAAPTPNIYGLDMLPTFAHLIDTALENTTDLLNSLKEADARDHPVLLNSPEKNSTGNDTLLGWLLAQPIIACHSFLLDQMLPDKLDGLRGWFGHVSPSACEGTSHRG